MGDRPERTQPRPLVPDPPHYTDRPLPPYRYVPGGPWSHPVKHAEGHMRDQMDAPEPLLPPQRWAEQSAYLYGVDLFNFAYWWEAHEAWEGLWHEAAGAQRLHLHGLIQLSACLLKWHTGRPRGVRILSRKARGKLREVAERSAGQQGRLYMGLDLPALLETLDAVFTPFDQADGWHPLAEPIVLRLTPDASGEEVEI